MSLTESAIILSNGILKYAATRLRPWPYWKDGDELRIIIIEFGIRNAGGAVATKRMLVLHLIMNRHPLAATGSISV